MSYAIIKLDHQQFRLKPGDTITVNGTLGQVGQQLKLGDILLLDHDTLDIGTPTLPGEVVFTVKAHQKSPKITIRTFKAKSRTRRTLGHRQDTTQLELVSAGPLKASAPSTTAKPVAKKAPAKTSVKPAAKTKASRTPKAATTKKPSPTKSANK